MSEYVYVYAQKINSILVARQLYIYIYSLSFEEEKKGVKKNMNCYLC